MARTKKLSPKKALNRAVARAMRAEGLSPSGVAWTGTKALVTQGLSPEAAARIVRGSLPVEEQDAALAAKALLAQRKTGAKTRVEVTHAPIAQAPTRLSSRALDVKAGKVARDEKGRLLAGTRS